MKNFKELDKRNVDEVEESILESWGSVNEMYNKQVELRKNDETFVFYDGPAFANGFPGLHHMVSKNLKDTITKYHVMNGKKVIRKIGWDTHGLPIENHVEKKLGISSKKEIEKLGVEKFNQECRNSVRANEDAFTKLTSKMGQFFDVEHPYLTYKNDYIETEWWILSEMYKKGMFYEGTRVVPYCPHCGTGLATHEVAQNYQTDTAITVYVPFKKKNEDIYFLVWTTTPWTLIANVALCVNPDEEYSLVESKGTKFILASSLVEKVLGEEVTKYNDEMLRLLDKAKKIVSSAKELNIDLTFNFNIANDAPTSYKDIVTNKEELESLREELKKLEKEYNQKKSEKSVSDLSAFLSIKEEINGITTIISITNDYEITEIKVKDKWLDKTLQELDFRNNYRMNVILVKKSDSEIEISPNGSYVIEKGDRLVVINHTEN